MIIEDPRAHAKIDTTGWDLEHLAELCGTMRLDALGGSDRELTDEEAVALASPEIEGLLPAEAVLRGWALGDKLVTEALERLSEIVHLALDERDLPRALAKLAGETGSEGELTAGERVAYANFVDSLDLDGLHELLGGAGPNEV